MKFKCSKCECTEVHIRQAGKHTGLYCSKCNAWIKWLSKPEVKEAYEYIKKSYDDKKVSFRTFHKRNGATVIRCSECGCQLYHSNMPKPQGQFDLIDAKFCPLCGLELI